MMTNPFCKHGIDHLSPSSLAVYRNAPALWVMRYLYKFDDERSAAAFRGLAVEAGLDYFLFESGPTTEATNRAMMNFALNTDGEINEEIEAEMAVIPQCLGRAIVQMEGMGKPIARQKRIEINLPGIEVPIMGYIDYRYPEFLVDLKTTLRMPSTIRPDHMVQLACYSEAEGVPPHVCYVTPKKAEIYPLQEKEKQEALWTLKHSAHAIRALLDAADTKEEAAKLFVPDTSHYMFSDSATNAARKIWL